VKKKANREKDVARRNDDVVLIEDLTPRDDDVRGGSGKLRFGQGTAPADRPTHRPRRGPGQSD
jgi:hypothetical protein